MAKKKKAKRVRSKRAGAEKDFVLPTPEKLVPRKKLSKEQKTYMLERELRRYVKRTGGFRKNLPKSHMDVAKQIMKLLGRKEPKWDKSIVVFGVDQATVARINVDES